MKKTTGFALMACLLLGLSARLPAPPQRAFEIAISVADLAGERTIDMGEKYAYAVPRGATIKWTCEFAFMLQWEKDTPFAPEVTAEPGPRFVRVLEKKTRLDALVNHLYKYTIFVVDSADNNRLLTLDPVIIIIPPGR
jgi:hypothetical protein